MGSTLTQFEFNPDDIYYYKGESGYYINNTTFEKNNNYDYLRLKIKITPDSESLGTHSNFSVTSSNNNILNVTDQTPSFWKSTDNRMYVNNIKVEGTGTATLTFTFNGSDDYAGPVSFSQAFTITEATAPTAALSTPSSTTAVPVNTSIVLTTDRAVTAVGETINGTIKAGSNAATAITFTLTNGNTLTYTPSANLENGTNYTVVLNADQVQASNGMSNAATTFTFTTVEGVATISAVSDKVWNFSDWSAATYSTTTIVEEENIEFITANNMVIDGSNKSFTDTDETAANNLGTLSFTKRFKTGGTSSASNRLIHIKVKKGSTIQIVALSQGNDSRTLYLCKDNYNTSSPVSSLSVDGTTLQKLKYTYNTQDEATEADFYIGTSGGIGIYYIEVSSNKALVTMRPGGSQAGTSEANAKATNTNFPFYIVPTVENGSITDLFGSTGGNIDSKNFTITSSNSDVVSVSSVYYSASTDDLSKGRFIINNLHTGTVGGHADITLKYLGTNTYSEATTTFTIYVNGPQPFQISSSNINVQNGQKAYIMPSITNADGNAIGFDTSNNLIILNDDESVDYDDYFNFSYSIASNDAGLSLDATDNSIIVSTRGDSYVGKTANVTITATPKPTYASNFTNGTATKTITVTVQAYSSGNYISFYLDKEKTTQVTDVYSYERDGSTSVFSNFPNGRVIYLDFNKENLERDGKTAEEIWFSYNVGSSVKLTPSDERKNDYSKKQYLVNLNHGGMVPIHIDNATNGDVYVNFQCFNYTENGYTSVGSVIPVKFQVVDHTRPDVVAYDPAEANTERSTAQSVLAIGTPSSGNSIYSKFSSTGTKYTIEGLVNEPNVTIGVEKVGVFSTEVSYRKISGVQVHHTDSDGDYVSIMSNNTYDYLFATTLALSQNEYHIDLPTAEGYDFAEPTVTASYYNKVQKKQIDASSGENITISYSVVNSNGADVSVDPSTGAITLGENSGMAVVTVTYNNTNDITVNKRTSKMEVATTTYTIYLTRSGEHLPKISPASKKFYPDIEVTVKADSDDKNPTEAWDAYYLIQDASVTAPDAATIINADNKVDKNSQTSFTLYETKKVYAVAYNGTTYSNIISETYTLGEQVLPPSFVPDGVSSTYTYHTETLGVEARAATAGSEVYYTIGQGSMPSDPVIGAAGTYRYDGLQGITLSDGGTTYIKALAYKDGIQSTIVTATYQYADMSAPYFNVNGSGKYTSGSLTVLTTDPITIGSDANAGENTLVHYYTLDGSDPTPENGIRYTKAFKVVKTVTGKAMSVLVDGTGEIVSNSAITTVTFNVDLPDNKSYVWETNDITTPSGRLLYADGLIISADADIKTLYSSTDNNAGTKVNLNSLPKDGQPITFAQPDITATFGGTDHGSWANFTINDEAIGTPIDGVGKYNIKNNPILDNDSGEDAKDELGRMYSHINTGLSTTYDGNYWTGINEKVTSPNPTTTHEKTFKVPSRGTYVKFEPQKDGEITIWALQQGGIHYKNDSKLCDRFVRRRPVYFIDEQGKSYPAKEAISSARLSAHWQTIINGYAAEGKNWFTALGSRQNDAANNFYNNDESEALYNMFMDYFMKRGDYADASKYGSNTITIGDPIQPIPIHTASRATNPITERGGHNSDNSTDMTGYVLASGGYVRYTFEVKAGKTYYFFGHATKIGIRGFQFVADTPDDSKILEISETATGTTNSTTIATAKNSGETKKVTYTGRTFAADKWVGVVLPFSMSATQVEKTFGAGTSIVHFNRVEGRKLYLTKHSHQMIVAGTPVIIKPTKDATISDLYAQVEAENVDEMAAGSYTFTGSYDRGTVKQYDYYFGTSGNLIQRKSSGTMELKPARAWLSSPGGAEGAKALEIAFDNFDENTVIDGIEFIIDGVSENENSFDNTSVYGVNGQIIRKNSTSLEGLPKGIYIVNGKKYVVK
ncbi:MAG: Ig-like domain-containing protein [Prevotella sp.]|nr:Ig-like domain-containing protein [Prevotella sp.]